MDDIHLSINQFDLHHLGEKYTAKHVVDTSQCIDGGKDYVDHCRTALAQKMADDLLENQVLTIREIDGDKTIVEAQVVVMTRQEYISLMYHVQNAFGSTVVTHHG